MNAVGLIFADSYDADLGGLTELRTLAAVSYGARYRLIDFMLSNMANAGIRNIGIITTQKYGSLMWHVRSGTGWDLDRKSTGVRFLPPFATKTGSQAYENRLEAMQANLAYLRECKEKYVLFGSCNYAANIDFQAMLDFHEKSGAVVTGLYTKEAINKKPGNDVTQYVTDENGKILECKIVQNLTGGEKIAANTYIIEREELIRGLEETSRAGKKSFRKDVIPSFAAEGKAMAYEAKERLFFLDDLSSYLASNLMLLEPDVRYELLRNPKRPIITRVKDSAPTRYGTDAKATNSIIADGAIIDGEVRNSIVFRGARIKKGAVVENSVIMQDTTIGEGAKVNYAILDKKVIIQDSRLLSGYITHPFYAGKGTVI